MTFLTKQEKKLLFWILFNPNLKANSISTKQNLDNLKTDDLIKITETNDGSFQPTLNTEKLDEIKKVIDTPNKVKEKIALGSGINLTPSTLEYHVIPNEQILIKYNVENKLDDSQFYAYSLEIQNEEGITVSTKAINGNIKSNEKKKLSIPCKLENPGNYTIEVSQLNHKEELVPIIESSKVKIQVK